MRILVVCGGDSKEREVSLSTGKAVFEALKKNFSDVECVVCGSLKDCIDRIVSSNPDRVFIALHGGYGENGQLQAALDSLGIKYTGCSFRESVVAMDKFLTKSVLKAKNIPTAEFMLIENLDDIERVDFYPVCIKPQAQGSSVDVYFAKNRDEALVHARGVIEKYGTALVERKLNGKELTVGIVFDDILPVIHIKPRGGFYDYKHKYTKGATEYIVPADIDEGISRLVQDVAYRAYKSIGCKSYARVDIILEGNVPYVLEINTIPGMTETSLLPKAALAKGITFENLVKIIVEGA